MIDIRPFLHVLVTAPAAEPMTLAEAKLFLRVDGNAEDDLITAMVSAVRISAERYMKQSLMMQTWKLVYNDYVLSETFLPQGPVQSITSVSLVARDGTLTLVDSSAYYLSARKDTLIFDATPFAHQVEVVYVAGYGNAADVPAPLKQGLYLHLSALYQDRSGSGAIPPDAVALYAPYRVVKL